MRRRGGEEGRREEEEEDGETRGRKRKRGRERERERVSGVYAAVMAGTRAFCGQVETRWNEMPAAPGKRRRERTEKPG
jgi:hypothetical protein